MQKFFHPFLAMIMLLMLSGCVSFNSRNASGHYDLWNTQCVPYARSQSGIQLYGDAYTWWDQAEPRYRRGNIPVPGAVLVLARTPRMTHGHLAVVKNIIDQRQIDVTQSNWGSGWQTRRVIYDLLRVQDVSTNNDWTLVRFWNRDAKVFGFPYPAKGFVYP